jgi:hypothetical protein
MKEITETNWNEFFSDIQLIALTILVVTIIPAFSKKIDLIGVLGIFFGLLFVLMILFMRNTRWN